MIRKFLPEWRYLALALCPICFSQGLLATATIDSDAESGEELGVSVASGFDGDSVDQLTLDQRLQSILRHKSEDPFRRSKFQMNLEYQQILESWSLSNNLDELLQKEKKRRNKKELVPVR